MKTTVEQTPDGRARVTVEFTVSVEDFRLMLEVLAAALACREKQR